jgi:hypothetical protein
MLQLQWAKRLEIGYLTIFDFENVSASRGNATDF